MAKSKTHLRQIGISEAQFSVLVSKLEQAITEYLERYPIKKRGVKSKIMTTEKRLLLTLTYLRHYPTFINLGEIFGISESYAHKIYHKTVNHLIGFIHPKKLDELTLDDVRTVIIDAAEQAIERPVKKQKSYYSGKKNDTL